MENPFSVPRHPAVAGYFYPDDPALLKNMIKQFLKGPVFQGPSPKALIVPHAGYQYSGQVAGQVFRLCTASAPAIRRVILLGPAHRVPFEGLALSAAQSFITPLGSVEVDATAWESLKNLSFLSLTDRPHRDEHALEVEVPFLQSILSDFKLVPLVVGDAFPEDIEEALDTLEAERSDTLIVISSDLSHYHSYEEAKKLDSETANFIEQLQDELIDFEQACGALPIKGLIRYARSHHLSVRRVALANSGDESGDRSRVVGYGGFVFETAPQH